MSKTTKIDDLITRLRAGNEAALARMITLIEREDKNVPYIMEQINKDLGKAYTIGITGPPGAGKSTLTDKMTRQLRDQGFEVAIIAIDPSSPFTGGAVLGDRVRMESHYLDPGVFIRSIATRGSHGGLSRCVQDAVKLCDAAGKDFILLETVGVGQTELDIIQVADSVQVVLVPESGDSIQMLKAGLMEIADVFVVNKADRDPSGSVAASLKSILQLKYNTTGGITRKGTAPIDHENLWYVPVLQTEGLTGAGVDKLIEELDNHRKHIEKSGEIEIRRKQRLREELTTRLQLQLTKRLQESADNNAKVQAIIEQVVSGEVSSHSVTDQLIKELL